MDPITLGIMAALLGGSAGLGFFGAKESREASERHNKRAEKKAKKLASEMMRMQKKANEMNQQRYQQMLSDSRSAKARTMKAFDRAGNAEIEDADQIARESGGGAKASMNARGLGQTTAATAVSNAVASNRARARSISRARVAERKAMADADATNRMLDIINGRMDEGPDQGDINRLLMFQGAPVAGNSLIDAQSAMNTMMPLFGPDMGGASMLSGMISGKKQQTPPADDGWNTTAPYWQKRTYGRA